MSGFDMWQFEWLRGKTPIQFLIVTGIKAVNIKTPHQTTIDWALCFLTFSTQLILGVNKIQPLARIGNIGT